MAIKNRTFPWVVIETHLGDHIEYIVAGFISALDAEIFEEQLSNRFPGFDYRIEYRGY